jgi:hypothetical protein
MKSLGSDPTRSDRARIGFMDLGKGEFDILRNLELEFGTYKMTMNLNEPYSRFACWPRTYIKSGHTFVYWLLRAAFFFYLSFSIVSIKYTSTMIEKDR